MAETGSSENGSFLFSSMTSKSRSKTKAIVSVKMTLGNDA